MERSGMNLKSSWGRQLVTLHLGMGMVVLLSGCASTAPHPLGAGGDTPQGDGGADQGGAGQGGAGQGGAGQGGETLCGKQPGGDLDAESVVRFEAKDSQGQALVVQLHRKFTGPGAGQSRIFELRGFHLMRAGKIQCLEQPNALSYQNTHHNFSDLATARLEDGSRTELAFNIEAPLPGDDPATRAPFNISFFDADGRRTDGPLSAVVTGMPHFCRECLADYKLGISEVLLSNRTSAVDEAGEHEPWVELLNPNSDDVALAGWSLSDDLADRRKWPLPTKTLGRNQALVVFLDGETDEGPLHSNFRVEGAPTQLILTAPGGTTDGGLHIAESIDDKSLTFRFRTKSFALSAPTPGEVDWEE